MSADILTLFGEKLALAGLAADGIEADGRLHRCGTSDKPCGQDGAYKAFLDPPASLWWKNWRTGDEGTWCAKSGSSLTTAEREALKERIRRAGEERAREERERYARAADEAASLWASAFPAPDEHAYLKRKGVPALGLKLTHDGKLIVPVQGGDGELHSLQFIAVDGTKRFLPGGKMEGGFFALPAKDGRKDGPLCIGEGYATMASVHLATGRACLVAFNAGNLPPVAKLARDMYPEREIVLCADNDTETRKPDGTPRNPGVEYATRAAASAGARLAVPPAHEGRATDFNDLLLRRGTEAVRHAVESASPEPAGEGNRVTEAPPGEPEAGEGAPAILPPPPAVPLEAFPPSVSAMLEEASEAFTVPLQIPAACLLSLLSCLVGRSRLICLKESWKEAGNLWLAVVAQSGMGKSPLISAFFNVVDRLEHEARKAFDAEYAEYEDLLLERQTQRTHNARAKARGKEIDAGPVPIPDEPTQRQVTADDVTVEALGEILKGNPKGVLWLKDELSGMLFDLDKYSSNGGGGTKARLLSSYDCKRWKTNRTSNPRRNIDIPRACVSIFGGIQPGMLTKAFEAGAGGTDEESGFLPRFIFIRAVAEAPGYWNERTFSRSSTELLDAIAAALWSWDIEYGAEGGEVERIVPVSRQAKALYVRWYNAIAEEAFISDNAALLAKLRGQAQRLCLLLHSLDAALAGTDGMSVVTEDCMRRALMLADWVKEHQAHCWRFFRPEEKAKQADPIERAIMAVVVEQAARIEADGWKISNADLCSLVEAKLNMPGLSAVKIGKAASGMGLTQCWMDRNKRARTITAEKISSFRQAVGHVGYVGKPPASTVSGVGIPVGGLSAPVGASPVAYTPPTPAYTPPTGGEGVKGLEAQGLPTRPTPPTGDSWDNFDFNDPGFPDEDLDSDEVRI